MKCFTIEQPRDTPMVFTFDVLDKGSVVNFELFYGSHSIAELQILSKQLDGSGHIDFTTDTDGYYTYCVQKVSQELSPVRLALNIHYGYDNDHYEQLLKDHNFDVVNMQVHKLNDLLTMALNEADYQKHKEVEYHAQTEKMNNTALWWPVVQVSLLREFALCLASVLKVIHRVLYFQLLCMLYQIIILILAGISQVQHLKSFFKANKLI
jgi:hypothetical protein